MNESKQKLLYSTGYESTVAIISSGLKSENDYIIISDFASKYYLDDKAIPYIFEWDYLTNEDLQNGWIQANKSNLMQPINEVLKEFYGTLFDGAACTDLSYILQQCINAKKVYDKVFEEYEIGEVVFCTTSILKEIVRTGPSPLSLNLKGVSIAVLKYTLKLSDITFSDVVLMADREKSPGNHSIKTVAIRCIVNYKRTVRYIENILSRVCKKLSGRNKNNANIRTIMLMDMLRRREYENLIDLDNFEFNSLKYSKIPLNETLSYSDYERRMPDGEFNWIYKNSFMYKYFEKIMSECEISKNIIESIDKKFNEIGPFITIFGHDSFIREIVLSRHLKEIGLRSISMIHSGVMPLTAMRTIVGEPDNLILWNRHELNNLKEYIKEEKFSSIRFHVAGSLEYQNYSKNIERKYSKNPRRFCGGYCLILTSLTNIDLIEAINNGSSYAAELVELFEFIADNPSVNFILKPHPSFDFYDEYDYLIDKYKLPNLIYLKSVRLTDLFDLVTEAVLFSYPGSSFIECALNKIPVIFYKSRSSIDFFSEINVPMWIETVENFTSLGFVLNKLKVDYKFRYDLINSNLNISRLIVESAGCNPTMRIREILKELS